LSVALSSVEVDGKSYDIETNTFAETGKNHNKRNLGSSAVVPRAARCLADWPAGAKEL